MAPSTLDAPFEQIAIKTASTSHRRRKRLLTLFASFFMLGYAVVTLFPFYVLFIRTFVSTKESTTLHLWIPQNEGINLDAEVGNLAVNFNLDLKQVKKDLGIKGYVAPRDTLRKVAEKQKIPVERIEQYFVGFGTYNGWITLLGRKDFWQALARTIITTLLGIAGLCFLSMFTGYALAGLKRRDQMFIYNLYLLQMVIPTVLIIIPQFLLVQWLMRLIPGSAQPGWPRWIAQLTALVLIFIKGGALSTMVFTSAINQIPHELEESAQLDGASRLQYFFRILAPLMSVPIATVCVIMLPVFWNAFFEPYVYLDASNMTILPMISSYGSTFTTNFQIIYTGVFVSILPLLLVYMGLRRFFIRSIMAGAVKG